MTGVEVAAISLGAAVVKSACRLWLGDPGFATDLTSDVVDIFAGRVTSRFDQRRISRFFDDCSDVVARRLVTLLAAEFANTPGNEREAAVFAVRDTFAHARLTDDALFHADLDARLVERQLRPSATAVLGRALLSEGGEQIYWLVLRESCSYLVEVVTSLPKFSSSALTELLRRETAVLATLSRVLDRLPERRGVDDFAADYRRVVVNKLDRMELLGVTLADANRRYPLSVAYIDLSVLRRRSKGGRLMTRTEPEPGDRLAGSGGLRAENVLGPGRRAFVVGQAICSVTLIVISSVRVMLIGQFPKRKVKTIPLSQIWDIDLQRSLPARLFGYGKFVLESAPGRISYEINFMAYPEQVYLELVELILPANDEPGPEEST